MRNPYDYGVSVGVSVSDKSLTVVLSAETRTPYRYELQTDVEEMLQLPLLTDSRKVRNGITIYVNRQKYLEMTCWGVRCCIRTIFRRCT